ncbi:MAG TPA: Calx-beta domain-containing protein, partial [Pyrinomonadaceae bacterium]|nr:Calx-beta domain-containing protein [Pyrinomonadaceae bacterium]
NASNNVIQGNFIGTNASGKAALSNNSGGIFAGGLGNDVIGGTAAGAGNVISGNLNNAGVFVQYGNSNGATIQGNLIGTDVTGTVALGNFFGIWLNFGSGGNSIIGGTTSGARNVISGNRSHGILLSGFSSNNQIHGNLIGTDISGINPLGNSGNGVQIENIAARNRIGGLFAGQGNTIAFNGQAGVLVTGGPGANLNSIRRNSIFSNAGLGIDLGGDGVTQNDSGDGDIGPNDIQNFPVITLVSGDSQPTITGILNSTPNTLFSLDFYSSSSCDPSGNGEGTTLLGPGPLAVRTDSNGNASFGLALSTPLAMGHVITATATDPFGNTSEFSLCNSREAKITFSAANYEIAENRGGIQIVVNRTGDITQPMTVDYATSDMTASERGDYTTAAGKLRFAAGENTKSFNVLVSLDSFAEGSELVGLTLSNATGGVPLGVPSNATLQINDPVLSPVTNPIDNAQNFVRQHYHDFLNREPDMSGLVFWTNQITSCGTDTACIEIKRINVSAAFFLSVEFQKTGYLVYRTYKAGYGNLPGLPVPVRFIEFLPDTQEISRDVVVGQTGWEEDLESNTQAFFADFVTRTRFSTLHPTSLSPAAFVDALFANAGVIPTAAERSAAINEFGGAVNTADLAARARALRLVAENSTLTDQEFNKAFVLMQYFGYLRRNPDNAPDADFSGFDFWLNKLNQFNGNFINAEMVKAFITSGEYRSRFGQ